MKRSGIRALAALWVLAGALGLLAAAGTAMAVDAGAGEALGSGPRGAIALHGEPALGGGFRHLPYADPLAPNGGTLRLGVVGTYDSLNPFATEGTPASVRRDYGFSIVDGRVYESLMRRSADEPHTLYGLLAETVETASDYGWAEFTLNERARFSDGVPVRAQDVVFSFETLRDRGHADRRQTYARVAEARIVGPRRVRFVFSPGSAGREMALAMGALPVLPAHVWEGRDVGAASLAPPVGSGPYLVHRVDPGRRLVFERNPGYWGADLPVNRGLHNFKRIEVTWYADQPAAMAAFEDGLFHLRRESDPARWAQSYFFPDARRGLVLRESIPHARPSGFAGFVFNTRREKFADERVRRALTYAFDFERVNAAHLEGAYTRTRSYFDNTDLAARGPASAAERALLAPFPGAVRPEIMERGYVPPRGGSAEAMRTNLRRALGLLTEAGYVVRDRRLVHGETGRSLAFEILLDDAADEPVAREWAASLRRLGIRADVRMADRAEMERLTAARDFDVRIARWPGSLSPADEVASRWGSGHARAPDGLNWAGVKSPAADAAIAALLAAETRAEQRTAARALDRVLLSGSYALPLHHNATDWVAYWADMGHPEVHPRSGPSFWAWYMHPDN